MLCMSVLSNCISGNYINFGVFGLYNDPYVWASLGACLVSCLFDDAYCNCDWNVSIIRYALFVCVWYTSLRGERILT